MKNATNSPIFWNIPLLTFFNWQHTTRSINGSSAKSYFETLQEIQEDAFENWNLYDQEHEIDDDDIKQASEYIKSQVKKELSSQSKYTLDDYQDEIKSDIHRAKSDAYAGNYQDEFLKAFWKLAHDAIIKTAQEIGKKGGQIIITNGKDSADLSRDIKPEFWEATEVKIETTPEEMEKFYNLDDLPEYLQKKDDWQGIADYIIGEDWLNDDDIYKISDNQREYIDHYGTLGDTSDWMDYFKDYEETSYQIKKDIEEDKAKIDDKKHLSQEIGKNTANIRQLLAEYSTDKEYNGQILRQIGSIEAIIKKTA